MKVQAKDVPEVEVVAIVERLSREPYDFGVLGTSEPHSYPRRVFTDEIQGAGCSTAAPAGAAATGR